MPENGRMTYSVAPVARISVIDDHEQIIRGLRATLDEQADLKMVVGTGTVGELLDECAREPRSISFCSICGWMMAAHRWRTSMR